MHHRWVGRVDQRRAGGDHGPDVPSGEQTAAGVRITTALSRVLSTQYSVLGCTIAGSNGAINTSPEAAAVLMSRSESNTTAGTPDNGSVPAF